MVGSSARDAAEMKGFADKPLFSGMTDSAAPSPEAQAAQPGWEPPFPDLQMLPPWV